MALEMKSTCERCQSQLNPQGDAYICSFECTFCPTCAKAFEGTCPNCGGELVQRPRQKTTSPVERVNGSPIEAASITTEYQVGS
jgi:hypothetical protein